MVGTLVIGLDGACWSRIQTLADRDELPNLSSIRERGIEGTLQSTNPPMTPPAWTSMVTGVGPERHGINDFLEMNPETHQFTPLGESNLDVPALWDVFAAYDRTIGVLNLPMIFPPPPVEGCFVSGIPHAVEDGIGHPQWIQEVLETNNYSVTPRTTPDEPDAYLEELEQLVADRTEITRKVIERINPDLLWTVYMEADWAQHYLWNHTVDVENAVERIYRKLDEAIGELTSAVDDECNVVIVSDHGATRIQHEIHLNSLLETWGYLCRTERSLTERVRKNAWKTALNLGTRLPPALKVRLQRWLSIERHNRIREAAGRGQLALHHEIRWEDTTAFSYGYMGQIYINRADWYGRGTVSPEQYEIIQNNIINQFESLKHPSTGEKLVETARRGKDVYGTTGPTIPDVLVSPMNWNAMMYGDFSESWIQSPQQRIADHAPEGVFLAMGPVFGNGDIDIDAIDVAPMLLHLHGLPVPETMDGNVHGRMFTREFRASNEIRHLAESIPKISSQKYGMGSTDLESRLEDLGYL